MTALTLLWLSDLLCVDGGCHFLCPGNLPVRVVGSGGGGGGGGGEKPKEFTLDWIVLCGR